MVGFSYPKYLRDRTYIQSKFGGPLGPDPATSGLTAGYLTKDSKELFTADQQSDAIKDRLLDNMRIQGSILVLNTDGRPDDHQRAEFVMNQLTEAQTLIVVAGQTVYGDDTFWDFVKQADRCLGGGYEVDSNHCKGSNWQVLRGTSYEGNENGDSNHNTYPQCWGILLMYG